MTARVIQGSFLGGQPKPAAVQPKIAPPPIQAKTAAPAAATAFADRPPGPPIPAFGARAPGPPAPAIVPRTGAVQRHGAGNAFTVDSGALGLTSGGGKPLPDSVRRKMEGALGADFSNVRVHVGPQAERIGAIAFTVGSDVYFAPGRYQPDTVHGQQLLGHELAHVVQQRAGRVRNPLGPGLAVVQDHALEAEADRMGQRAAACLVGVQATRVMPEPALATLQSAPANLRTNRPAVTLTGRSSRCSSDGQSFRTANSPALAFPPPASRYAGLVQRARIPFRSDVRGTIGASPTAGRRVIQRLILYMANDQMHQEDAAAIARRRFWWDEANFYWGNVPNLTVNTDSTLTLLGHADQETFGGLTAENLVQGLVDRNIKTSTHNTLELIGCGASMTESRVNLTFVDQVRELLNARKFKKAIVVKGLKQPDSEQQTTLYRFANGKFVYITSSEKILDEVASHDLLLKRVHSNINTYYEKFIEYLNNTKTSYKTDSFSNIRSYLDVPTQRITHKARLTKSEKTELLLPGYET